MPNWIQYGGSMPNDATMTRLAQSATVRPRHAAAAPSRRLSARRAARCAPGSADREADRDLALPLRRAHEQQVAGRWRTRSAGRTYRASSTFRGKRPSPPSWTGGASAPAADHFAFVFSCSAIRPRRRPHLRRCGGETGGCVSRPAITRANARCASGRDAPARAASRTGRTPESEPGRHYADDGAGDAVHLHRRARHARVALKRRRQSRSLTTRPRRAGPVVVRGKPRPDDGLDASNGKRLALTRPDGTRSGAAPAETTLRCSSYAPSRNERARACQSERVPVPSSARLAAHRVDAATP